MKMPNDFTVSTMTACLISAGVVALAGCGGSSNTDTPPPVVVVPPLVVPPTISGVAATGNVYVAAVITIQDATGKTTAPLTVDANGAYKIDVTGLVGPYLILARDPAGVREPLMSVVVDTVAAGAGAKANVTPLTTAAVGLTTATGHASDVLNNPALAKDITTAKLASAITLLNTVMSAVLNDAGLDPAKYNPIADTFAADHTGGDKVLDVVNFIDADDGIKLTNRSAVVADNATPVSVVLKPADLAAPTATTKLPAPIANLSGNVLDFAKAAFEKCYAHPVAERVTKDDAARIIKTVNADCQNILTDTFLQNGSTAGETFYDTLGSEDMTGAVFEKPKVLLFTSESSAIFRIPYKDKNGNDGHFTLVGKRIPGTISATRPTDWWLDGNQQPFDIVLRPYVFKFKGVNPARVLDRYSSGLNVFVNPIGKNVDIKNVKVQGPGLPAAGIVLTRSTACGPLPGGKLDFMTIANKTGSTSVSSSSLATTNFEFAAVDYAGKAIVPTEAATRAVPAVDYGAIPAFAVYTITVTKIDGTVLPAYNKRVVDPMISPVTASTLAYNDYTADTLKALDPASTLAGAVAELPVAWTQNPNAESVLNIRVFSSRFATSTTPGTAVDGIALVAPKATSIVVKAPAACSATGSTTANGNFIALTADGTTSRALQQTYRRADDVRKFFQTLY